MNKNKRDATPLNIVKHGEDNNNIDQDGPLDNVKSAKVLSLTPPANLYAEKVSLGYICIPRSIEHHWIWQKDPLKFQMWVDIVFQVNYTSKIVNLGNQLVECKRGQSLNSLDTWARRWKVDKSKVRRFFDLLKKGKMIVTENVLKTTRLTVCDYDSYSGYRHVGDTITTQSQHDGDTIATPNKKEKNINNRKKEKKIEADASKPTIFPLYKEVEQTPAHIKDFIDEHKPEFIEPYVDLWNLFAFENALSKVKSITQTREVNLKERLKEELFNLSEIIRMAKESEWLLGQPWFTFGWIVKDQNNYIKVLEGNYISKTTYKKPIKKTPSPMNSLIKSTVNDNQKSIRYDK